MSVNTNVTTPDGSSVIAERVRDRVRERERAPARSCLLEEVAPDGLEVLLVLLERLLRGHSRRAGGVRLGRAPERSRPDPVGATRRNDRADDQRLRQVDAVPDGPLAL